MDIGRISGKLLASNLLRDGVDLAFETDLLYLDVNNRRIGINQTPNSYDLEVNSSIRTDDLSTGNSITVDDLTINVNNSITSMVNPIEVFTADPFIFHDRMLTDSLIFDDNKITTFTNENIILDPNGTGIVDILSGVSQTGDLSVFGNVGLTGNLRVDGNIILGDNVVDTVEISADLTRDIIPSENNSFDIGTPALRWRNIRLTAADLDQTISVSNFVLSSNPTTIASTSGDIVFVFPTGDSETTVDSLIVDDSIKFEGNLIEGLGTNENLRFNPNASGTINLEATANIIDDLSVSTNIDLTDLTVIGDITLGNASTDTTTINAGIINDLIPDTNLTYNIGSLSKRWRQGYVSNVEIENSSTAANFTIDNTPSNISVSSGDINFIFPEGNSTVTAGSIIVSDAFRFEGNLIEGLGTNENLRFNPNASGTINLEAETNVTGDFSISGNSVLSGDLSTANNLIIGDQITDTVMIAPDLTQDIIPGTDRVYDLGRDAGDSSPRYWQDAYILDNTNITSVYPMSITISEQTLIDGTTNTISTIQSNENLQLSPATGVTIIEEIKFGNAPPTLIITNSPNISTDFFGRSVDTSASYFIVGAFAENVSTGAAYIYSATTGTLITTLSNPNAYGASTLDNFGWDVAISESYAVVSAPNEDEATATNSGRVYVFSTADWSLLHTLTNPNTYGTPGNENFGYKIEVSESYVIVGADAEDDVGVSFVGRAYIYDAATGTLLHTLNNPTGNPNDYFGSAVAITETYAAVSARNYPLGTSIGRVYIFNTSDGSLRNTIDNPTNTTGQEFGLSVDITDSYTIVGSPNEFPNGRAYIFDTATGSLAFTLSNPNAFSATILDRFGESVGITNSYAIVGASREDDVGYTNTGKAYIFSTVDGSLLHTLDNPNPDGVSNDNFGFDVAINELSAVIGVNKTTPGEVYFFLPLSGSADEARITNLNTSTPLTLAATGIGYYNFAGTNAMLLPAGDDAARPGSPEVGDTRWSTERNYLEVYDGTVYLSAAGDTGTLTAEDIEDNSFVYTIILG